MGPQVLQHTLRGRRRVTTGALALALVLALRPATAAEGSPVGERSALPFAIGPQPMATALLAWGKQANVQVLTASGAVASWRSAGASGLLTPDDALVELLEGTDLEREAYDAHTVVVRQRQKASNATPAPVDPQVAFDPHSVTPLATVDVRGILSDDGYKADTTRTATRTESNLNDVPQSISVVTREVIASQQAVSIGDVARYVAGVQYVDGYGGSPLFLIRGFDAGNGMTDGMPNGIARTEDLPPLIGIERVEVLRGPEAILGDASQNNNFGGSINVVMKRPQADTVRTLTWSAGQYDGARLGLDLAGTASKDGAWTYRLVAAGQGGQRTPQGSGHGRGTYLAPSFAWQGDDTRFMGGLEYVDNRVPGPEHTVLLGASLSTASPYRDLPDVPDDYSTYRTTRAVFEFDRDIGDDWSFHSQGQYVRQHSDGRNWSYTPGDYYGGFLVPVARSFRYKGSYWTWQNDLRTTFGHGDTTHTVLLGFDVARTHAGDSGIGSVEQSVDMTMDNDRSAQIITRPLSFDLATGARMSEKLNSLVAPVTTVQNLGGSWQTNAGLYLQDQVSIGEKWNVLAAIRRTTYQLDTHWDDGMPRRQRKSRWVPKLGVVYKVAPDIALYADTAVGFQPDPLLGKDGQPLPAVTSRQVELGGKFDLFDQRARLTAALYRIRVDHSVDLVSPEPPFFATPGPGQTNRGLEVEFTGNIAPGLDVLASLTETRIHNHDDTRPTGTPKHQAAVWGSYRLGGGTLPWGIAAGVIARSKSYGRTSEQGQYFGIPGQASVETNVTRYGDHWRVTLGVKNLFRRTLYAVNFDDTFVPIRQGRTVLLTGSYDF